MRTRVLVMAGVLVLSILASGGVGWATTFEDVVKEMAATPTRMGTFWDIRVPLIFSGTTGMLLTEVCVSGDSVRPIDPSKRSMDMGKVRPGNQYTVVVNKRIISDVGDHIYAYQRTVELPACK